MKTRKRCPSCKFDRTYEGRICPVCANIRANQEELNQKLGADLLIKRDEIKLHKQISKICKQTFYFGYWDGIRVIYAMSKKEYNQKLSKFQR